MYKLSVIHTILQFTREMLIVLTIRTHDTLSDVMINWVDAGVRLSNII